MGILDNVERGLERAVNGAFARTFRSGVQPVEIAAALKKELDVGSVIVDRDRVLAPNSFVVRVSPKDFARLNNLGDTLEQELHDLVKKHARRQNYQLTGEADVEIREDRHLTTGVLEIDATRVQGAVSWVPTLEIDGTRHELSRGNTLIGRGSDCSIRITDSAASRHHLEIVWDGSAGLVRDLGSTNGSKINGERFREAALAAGTVITVGQTAMTFQLSPARQRSSSAPRGSGNPGRPAGKTGDAGRARTASPSKRSETHAPEPGGNVTYNPGAATRQKNSGPSDAPGLDQDFWSGL